MYPGSVSEAVGVAILPGGTPSSSPFYNPPSVRSLKS